MAVLLNVEHLRKHFTDEPVLVDVTFQIRTGDKIGLVGPNGCGKTTLLNILAGREESEKGSIEKSGDILIGYLEQRPEVEPGKTVLEDAQEALSHLIELQHEAEQLAHKLAEITEPIEHNRLAARYDRIHEELLRHDAYHLDHRVEKILHGLGFFDEDFTKPTTALSGGELNRLSLAKLLLAEPDIMLLDEPSNHLDLLATEWLEDFLKNTSASVLLVSHDRYFLDRVTNRTFELFHGTIDEYPGNFSKYTMLKEERLLVQTRTYEKYAEDVEKAKDFIRRHHYGMKAAQAEDRRKKLDRLLEEPAALPKKIESPPMSFPEPSRTGDIAFRVENLSKGFNKRTEDRGQKTERENELRITNYELREGEQGKGEGQKKPVLCPLSSVLFKNLTFDIERGQRWAVLGPNGCGKTTFLRCLIGELAPDTGSTQIGQGVKIGYFDQQLHVLDDSVRTVDAIRPERRVFEEPARRSLLGAFGLTGDQQLQTVGSLSGGQRCRAALAKLAAEEANVLILDEPTNHLDLWARAALERAVANFNGTVIFISHDRYFVDQVADHLLIIQPNSTFRTLEGNYSTFRHMVSQGLMADPFLTDAFSDRRSAVGKSAIPAQQRAAQQAKPSQQKKQVAKKTAATPQRQQSQPQKQSLPQQANKPLSEKDQRRLEEQRKWKEEVRLKEKEKANEKKIGKNAGPTEKFEKKKRKFSYRKTTELEEEIFARETRILSLNEELLVPQVVRDPNRAREIHLEIAEEQQKLAALYEHWEEASELNWDGK